jgi:hypothetical protein
MTGGDIASRRRSTALLEIHEITLDEVLRAGRVLYGPAFAAEAGAWRESLKATYRRRAMETHPDRARSLGRSERELAREFKAVSDAYRILSALDGRPVPRAAPFEPRRRAPRPPWRPPARPPARPRPAERGRAARPAAPPPPPPPSPGRPEARGGGPRVRVGVRPQDLPRRRLRFAEFLYYSGRVGWEELVASIAWQRAQRPPVGRIAVEFGFLTADDVAALLERRRVAGLGGMPLGEFAVREGYLTSFQLLAVLGQQLRQQRPIGQFFVERGILDADDIEGVRRRILRHNTKYL